MRAEEAISGTAQGEREDFTADTTFRSHDVSRRSTVPCRGSRMGQHAAGVYAACRSEGRLFFFDRGICIVLDLSGLDFGLLPICTYLRQVRRSPLTAGDYAGTTWIAATPSVSSAALF